jgi:hypothetical protein
MYNQRAPCDRCRERPWDFACRSNRNESGWQRPIRVCDPCLKEILQASGLERRGTCAHNWWGARTTYDDFCIKCLRKILREWEISREQLEAERRQSPRG